VNILYVKFQISTLKLTDATVAIKSLAFLVQRRIELVLLLVHASKVIGQMANTDCLLVGLGILVLRCLGILDDSLEAFCLSDFGELLLLLNQL
jgi:hypothetical protein